MMTPVVRRTKEAAKIARVGRALPAAGVVAAGAPTRTVGVAVRVAVGVAEGVAALRAPNWAKAGEELKTRTKAKLKIPKIGEIIFIFFITITGKKFFVKTLFPLVNFSQKR